MQGLLAKRLEQAGFHRVPPVVREQLQRRMRAQSLFTLSLTGELFRVLEDFSRAGIEVIPVKGPVMSQLAYGDPALRSFGDLDLLLRQRDIPVAIQRMLALGFDPDLSLPVVQSKRIPGEYLFRRSGTPRLVELHTERTFRHYPKPMPIEEMIARRRRVMLDGRDVPALSLEDEVVFDCVHGGKDFWERLMWVADVAALLARHSEIDWGKVQRFAAEVGAERMLYVGVCLAAFVLSAKIPSEVAAEIGRDREAKALCTQIGKWLPYAGHNPPTVTARALYRMKMAGGGVSGAQYLMRLSLSPTEDDWEENRAESGFWVWDAIRRPLRLLRKYGSGE